MHLRFKDGIARAKEPFEECDSGAAFDLGHDKGGIFRIGGIDCSERDFDFYW